ncbi:hypothetical protein [Ekhidna sp.]|uniref:hypothetical protein n=1 Tax=Ekhidna sp. TaxID=2608089 RepID=UPI003298A6D4
MQKDTLDSVSINGGFSESFEMTSQIWIGFGFTTGLLLVFIWIVLGDPYKVLNEVQYNILRVLAALLGAFAAWFISGDSIIQISESLKGVDFVISGTLGFSILILIYLKFPKYPKNITLPDGYNFNIDPNWVFEDVVIAIAGGKSGNVEFEGFDTSHLKSKMKPAELSYPNELAAIIDLARFSISNIPPYKVTILNGGVYKLSVKNE